MKTIDWGLLRNGPILFVSNDAHGLSLTVGGEPRYKLGDVRVRLVDLSSMHLNDKRPRIGMPCAFNGDGVKITLDSKPWRQHLTGPFYLHFRCRSQTNVWPIWPNICQTIVQADQVLWGMIDFLDSAARRSGKDNGSFFMWMVFQEVRQVRYSQVAVAA